MRTSTERRVSMDPETAALASCAMTEIDVSVDDVAARRRAGAGPPIDVSGTKEWGAGRIAGARHVELADVPAQAGTIDRDTPVVFYCRVGGRSAMAANAFRQAGYDAYSMDGGIAAWAERGLPLEPDDGEVAPH
jgi:rhodanese-related sulfurtransferase